MGLYLGYNDSMQENSDKSIPNKTSFRTIEIMGFMVPVLELEHLKALNPANLKEAISKFERASDCCHSCQHGRNLSHTRSIYDVRTPDVELIIQVVQLELFAAHGIRPKIHVERSRPDRYIVNGSVSPFKAALVRFINR